MKKLILKFILLSYILNILFMKNIYATEDDAPDITCPYAGVYMMDNLKCIYGKNESQKISIASITKLMTAIVAIENIPDLNQKVSVDYSIVENSIEDDYAVAGIKDKQELTYYDLLATMLIPSGADSAVFLGNIVFGNMNTFVDKMNLKAKELGMNDTSFANVIGIDDENNYSTINDVAKLLKYSIENEIIKELITTKSYTTTDGTLTVKNAMNVIADGKHVTLNHTLGGKTGSTTNAGICLASYAEDEGHTFLCITAGADMHSTIPYNITDTEALYDYIANKYSYINILNKGDTLLQLDTLYSENKNFIVTSDKDISIYSDEIDENLINIAYSGEKVVSPLMKVGTKLGKIDIYYNDEIIDTTDVYLTKRLDFNFENWILDNYPNLILFVALIILILIIIKKIYSSKNTIIFTRKLGNKSS